MNKEKKTSNDGRTPARKLTREDLLKVTGGDELIHGCCTQECCGSVDPAYR